MGSADLMPRNLNRRVEVIFPVEDSRMIRNIRNDILETYLVDNLKARLMQPDGSYLRSTPEKGQVQINTQEHLLSQRFG